MTVWTEIADPGTRETVTELLSLCGITPGLSGPEGMLRIADFVPGTDADLSPGECAVFLVPRELSGEVLSAGGSGGRALFLPVPILLEEGIRVLTEAVRSVEAELSRAPAVSPEEHEAGDSADAHPAITRSAITRPAISHPADARSAISHPAVSFDGETVTRGGKSVRLTPREAACFRILYGRRGETVSRAELSGPAGSRSNLADVYIGYLRKKLRPLFGDGVILSVRGKGYSLRLP